MKKLYEQFTYLEGSDKIYNFLKEQFEAVVDETKPNVITSFAVEYLCQMLAQHHGQYPVLIIDDVDSPIAASIAGNYHTGMWTEMRGFLGRSLKANLYYEKAIVAGVMPINFYLPSISYEADTIFKTDFHFFFGFTKREVNTLLMESRQLHLMTNITDWYTNSSSFPKQEMYCCIGKIIFEFEDLFYFHVDDQPMFNPISVMACWENNWEIKTHANASDLLQESIKTRLFQGNGLFPVLLLQDLLENLSLKKKVLTDIYFLNQLLEHEAIMLGYLAHSGIISIAKHPSGGTQVYVPGPTT